ncbi:t-SNARE [Morchella snyderi]|nr:t-SNARE [Morchella snyderi]
MMSSTADSDPFIQFQNDVLSLLETTRQSFSSYLRIHSLTPSLTSPELASAYSDLTQNLTDLQADLTDLQASVGAIEQDPYKFGLDVPEVVRRRRFVDEVSNEVSDIREELAKYSPGSGAGGSSYPGGGEGASADETYTQFNLQQQQELLADQDLALEDVSRTVGNLREQAHEMNRELEEQAEMLDGVDSDATRVEDKLRRGVRDLNGFIRKNEDTASSCCIAVLILVLIILLALVLIL